MRKTIDIIVSLLLVVVFLAGFCVLLYPTVSDWWNSRLQSKSILSYKEAVASISSEDYEGEFAKAYAYNDALRSLTNPMLDYDKLEGYWDILDVTGTGIMGYISIPCINVELPIYHGTSDSVLNTGVGHLEGTTLPVGGENTHCVLSGHRGLPSAKLFSNLDKVEIGDIFTITVLNKEFTYEVDQITVIEPTDSAALCVVDGKEYVTLMTCTPYGVNTHRLLVRGVRVATDSVFETAQKSEPAATSVEST